MSDNCRNCNHDDFLIVKDLRLAQSVHKSGNPYQRWCGNCHSFDHGVSRDEYEQADTKHILRKDADTPEKLENEFDCPECGRHLYQQPDECGNCGAEYIWD